MVSFKCRSLATGITQWLVLLFCAWVEAIQQHTVSISRRERSGWMEWRDELPYGNELDKHMWKMTMGHQVGCAHMHCFGWLSSMGQQYGLRRHQRRSIRVSQRWECKCAFTHEFLCTKGSHERCSGHGCHPVWMSDFDTVIHKNRIEECMP